VSTVDHKETSRVREVTPLEDESKKRWRELCEQAVAEKDPDKFLATIHELLQVLEENEKRRRNAPGLTAPPGHNDPNLGCPVT